MADLSIGAHVDQADPLAEAAARQATLAQFFLATRRAVADRRCGMPG